MRKLERSKKNRIIAGVCGGIGEYFKVDPVLIRLLCVLAILGAGSGLLAYIIAWIIIPDEK
ncbi:PspC domain-containing protein [archaeon]|nr:PspC domain-containing protein [archaeon]